MADNTVTGYYTKNYIKELEELEMGKRWAPSEFFCNNLIRRIEDSKRYLDELEENEKIWALVKLNLRLVDKYRNGLIEEVKLELAFTKALYNDYSRVNDMDELIEKIDFTSFIKMYIALGSSNPDDIDIVISSAQEIKR